ncbi:procollagen-lysine,2-oxoglutarate 5-dioxygenase 1-like [Biomphalaria glabrata]|uniref:procollagen-lysine 5-dioxygenase n=1 Tax=Biomphalaria glabrata TaxID=6526 RepID=A0A9W2YP29_BIOGL|nr:procollagen-lysine,2-oxoglutarate 5-dioxygenase 1-like [Biomphalaria glabrata]XP_055864466.1 procollagen-lysine,2-oxoglutarate 5-dioxygenase 1-like [Biomphalaria glabrata]XP_055864467.1 procollagen-lysine,2-oxoglutarate 5-dioxygenase 1-like [Biomphalaria glabrata]XP_055864469.1 procollagen-lysine,2-oxoglutarate 5-dioxygenase 1-like [Biomphalaria glabrata]XP_055864470.1 procollagen-lysine,2-oxoglutarate 5-dioxygenase 1-like [Biomphalaria glabrata]
MKLVLLFEVIISLVIICCMATDMFSKEKPDLLVVTIATEENDGFRQFLRSAKLYGLNVKVLGLGTTWRGGTMQSTGGGHKINILREGLKPFKNVENLIIMFVDSYDVVFTDGKDAILDKFSKFNSRVIFSAEEACWPDKTLAEKYPIVKDSKKKYLNSGGFLGYAKEIYEIVSHQTIADDEDDQLYYTKIYINRALRHEWNMKLDTKAEIFQNLNWALGEIVIKYKNGHSYLYNIETETTPVVIHGNGPIKPEFYRLSNYLADGWTDTTGCLSCKEDLVDLGKLKEVDYPAVLVSIFIEYATPFIREFFEQVAALKYPKDKIDIYIHNRVLLHEKDVAKFLEDTKDLYKSTRYISSADNVNEGIARNWAIDECIQKNCKYLMTIDSVVQITKPELLVDLIEQNRSIIAPLLKRPGKLWSNFWGALGDTGYYARSEDYMDIINYNRVGLWNVPHATNLLLIHGHRLTLLKDAFTFNRAYDPDMSFSQKARSQNIFIYLTNRDYWGHLIYADEFETNHLNNELFEIFNNRLDWERRYIHKNYSKALEPDAIIEMPCPDVYWFPIVTETFCDEFVAEMENFGKWSNGKNEDPRLAGGYENVPTVDIHMNQVGYERHWLHFLREFVRPLQEKVFTGYFHDPPHALLNFIVRYKPDEQPLLRPHHDASTYTINIALNTPMVDFEGGGCRFLRYNCSITSPRKGWMFMHPGRLTHFHEGLRVTKGTRYIMVSFIDP